MRGKAGQPLVADIQISGVPESCVGKVSYALNANALPTGLTFNGDVGRISGTAAQAYTNTITGGFEVHVQGYRR